MIGIGLDLWSAARGGGGFDPLSLYANDEPGTWFDPADLSTLFQDADGTLPVTDVGQPVGKMLDKSGRGNHATQPTAINRPVLQRDTSGRLYLAFNGTNSWMSVPTLDMTTAAAITAHSAIYRDTLATVAVYAELSANTNTNTGAFYLSAPQTVNTIGGQIKGTTAATLATTTTAPGKWVVTLTGNLEATSGTTARLRINGATSTTSATVMAGDTFGSYPFYIGARGGTANWFSGRLYGLIVRGVQSTSAEIAAAEAWMNSRTGAY